MPVQLGAGKTAWIATGAYLAIGVAVVAAPVAVFPAAFFLPAAFSMYADRVGMGRAVGAGIVPMLAAFVPSVGAGVYLYGVLWVCALGMHLFRVRRNYLLSVALPAAIVSGAVFAAMYVEALRTGRTVPEMIGSWAQNVVNTSLDASRQVLEGDELAAFEESVSGLQSRIVRLFPSMVVSCAVAMMGINLAAVGPRLVRGFRVPDVMIAFFILAGALAVTPWEPLHTMGLNLLVVVGIVYLFQGIAVVSAFMSFRAWPLVVRWAIYIFIFAQLYMIVIVAGIGLFDAWFDFRSRMIRNEEGDER